MEQTREKQEQHLHKKKFNEALLQKT